MTSLNHWICKYAWVRSSFVKSFPPDSLASIRGRGYVSRVAALLTVSLKSPHIPILPSRLTTVQWVLPSQRMGLVLLRQLSGIADRVCFAEMWLCLWVNLNLCRSSLNQIQLILKHQLSTSSIDVGTAEGLFRLPQSMMISFLQSRPSRVGPDPFTTWLVLIFTVT